MVAAAFCVAFALPFAALEPARDSAIPTPATVRDETAERASDEVHKEHPAPATSTGDAGDVPSKPPRNSLTQRKNLTAAARTKAILGLTLIAILGLILLLFVWMGGRITRTYIRHLSERTNRLSRPSLDEDDWAKKPIIPRDPLADMQRDENA